MTHKDGFDARLRAAFEQADAQITPDPAFDRHVMARLGKTLNSRTLVLSLAGAGGSAIAASQLERLVDGVSLHNALMTQLFETIGSQSLAAGLFTLIAASLVLVLPRLRI